MQIRRKIPAAMGTEQCSKGSVVQVEYFPCVTSVTYFLKDLCTCRAYCSLLFELLILLKIFYSRCKLVLYTELNRKRKNITQIKLGKKEVSLTGNC